MSELYDLLHTIITVLDKIWHYGLVKVSDNYIHVSNIVLGTLLIVCGIKYSKRVKAWIKEYVHTKLAAEKEVSYAIERLLIYLIFCIYIISTLEISNVPLSTFAFIGGALAIGIGFGAQNLISNFISSIIIMLEHTIKIGDVIQINNIIGNVTSVGARSVILTTLSNLEIVIPNLNFMQSNVVNFTLSNNLIRYQLKVRLPKEVVVKANHNELMNKFYDMVLAIEIVVSDPAPVVYLSDVHHDSVCFTISLYCHIDKLHYIEEIRHQVNLSLLKEFHDVSFEVEYLKLTSLQLENHDNKEEEDMEDKLCGRQLS